jgi:hypothetical protein
MFVRGCSRHQPVSFRPSFAPSHAHALLRGPAGGLDVMCKRRASNDSARFKHHHLACEAGKDCGVDVNMSHIPRVLILAFAP